MRVGDEEADRTALALAAVAATATASVGAAAYGLAGGAAGLGVGVAGAALVHTLRGRRARRRRRLLATPFPARFRTFLEERCDPYVRLAAPLRARFEDDVRLFVAEKRITGVEMEVDDELRLLVAASAVTLSVGWPDYEWDQLAEVLVYPQDFDRDYQFGADELSGQTHPWGTVILSAPSLEESFDDPDDAYHVGLHEFAHLLDLEEGHFAGIPRGLADAETRAWAEVVERERGRLERGRSVLDAYGAEDGVEFFAVAVEAFFEPALEVRRRHGELYALLSRFFAQDPAAWDEARGLRYR